jgi:hypothetical protein
MAEAWTPGLRICEKHGRCRLWLGDYVYGDGRSLQEAADELVARSLTIAMSFRSGAGVRLSPELGPPDVRWFEFVYELGEIAAAGGDIRVRLFGPDSLAA